MFYFWNYDNLKVMFYIIQLFSVSACSYSRIFHFLEKKELSKLVKLQVEYFHFKIQLIHFHFIFKGSFRLRIQSHAEIKLNQIKHVLTIVMKLIILIAVFVTLIQRLSN